MVKNNSNLEVYVDDGLYTFFSEQLYREVSHMFVWNNIPEHIPVDYLERNLVRFGNVLYYEDENIGQDILRATVTGQNRHDLPVQARTYIPNTTFETTQVTRVIKRLTDGEGVKETFDPKTDAVLIRNMEKGQTVGHIVDHYAKRLALIQQSIDTNILWSNMPYIFLTGSNATKTSVNKLFSDIFSGKPAIIVDKELLGDNKDRVGSPTGVPFMVKDLLDVLNEVKMGFKQAVGFDTAGVDKAERVNTLEIESNNQHTTSVLDIMLQQRQIAANDINAFFGQNIEVTYVGATQQEEEMEDETDDEDLEEEEIEDGGIDSGASESIEE